jgi:NAD(P)-dependent dehydrogenase (short-subunit alcohol dehydrogenase family)
MPTSSSAINRQRAVRRAGSREKEFIENTIKTFVQRSPMGRLPKPEDVAYGALFLVSDEASYMNGVILQVDGGMVVRM